MLCFTIDTPGTYVDYSAVPDNAFVRRPHDERCAQTIFNRMREQSCLAASDMPETITLSKRNPSSRPAAVARVDTRLPRCVQRRLPCAPVSVRCHPRPTPYRCVVDHRTPRSTYRLPIGLSMTSRPVKPTSKSCVDRCPPGFLAIGTPRCKKSLSMMDLSAADPEIGDIK